MQINLTRLQLEGHLGVYHQVQVVQIQTAVVVAYQAAQQTPAIVKQVRLQFRKNSTNIYVQYM